jgi:hypothetical protein
MLTGRKLHNIQKAFNTLHTGATRSDENPPLRLQEPAKSGPFAGERLDPTLWQQMLDDYYETHVWNLETGWQTEPSLRALGLGEVIDKLQAFNRLPLLCGMWLLIGWESAPFVSQGKDLKNGRHQRR